MADQNLIDYVRSSLSQGYSPDSIRQALVQQGWDQGSIDEAFAIAAGGGAATQAPGAQVPGVQAPQQAAAAGAGKRSTIITVLCIIGFLFSALSAIGGIIILVIGSLFGIMGSVGLGTVEGAETMGALGSIVSLLAFLPIVTGIIGFVAFFLLLQRRRIGLILTIALGAISLVFGIYTLNFLSIGFWIFAIAVVAIYRKDFS